MKINPYLFLLCVAIFLTLTANISFFSQVNQVYPFLENIGFLLSLAVLLTALLWLLLLLLAHRYTFKIVVISLLMIASIAGHFTDSYGTIYDSNMLQNALQTDTAEASDLLNIRFIIRVLLLGFVPSVFIARLTIHFAPLKINLLQKLGAFIASLALAGLPILAFSGQYASFFREHKPLRYYTNPITPIYSTINLISSEYKKFTAPTEIIYHAKDATQTSKPSERKPKLIIMVVGETLRSANIPFNGYQRNTLPQLSQLKATKTENFHYFNNMTSCGTSTAYSVPCMFSYLGEKNYNVDEANYHENVLDTLDKLGVQVYWRDNNSSSKGVMDKLPKTHYMDYKTAENNTNCTNNYQECRDSGMLNNLDNLVSDKDTLIILHQMGNHGPAYYKRYDKKFAKFQPVCQSNELAECDEQSLINGYDNAIVATDDFLANTIKWLKKQQNNHQVALLYVSDHGESLGENGMYLHGMPKRFAPKEQYEIPAMLWLGKQTDFTATNENKKLNHDAITPTLLTLFDVKTQTITDKAKFVQ